MSNGTRQAPLAMDAETFRGLGHRLVDQLAELLESVPRGPVTRDESPSAVREALDLTGALPESGTDAGPLLERTAQLLFDHSLFNGHPRFFGYITAPPAPIGILGDLLAAALNPNVGGWMLSPAATEIEVADRPLDRELIGYPADCGGLLVSGGNMANFVCFLAARAAKARLERARARRRRRSGRRLRVYASAETHTWIQKAADLGGLGTASIRWIPTDATLRMDVDALAPADRGGRRRGRRAVPGRRHGRVGQHRRGRSAARRSARSASEHGSGSTSTAPTAASRRCCPTRPTICARLQPADSVAVDPHKWLYAPLEAGCALVRDPDALRAAFAYHPPYYHFEERATNYVDYGPQNSRGFRALKVWLALRHAGAAGYRRMIADDIRLSQAMADGVDRHAELAAHHAGSEHHDVPLRAVAIFGRRSESQAVERHLDALNRELLDRLQRGGEAFVSNAVVGGRYVLRACIVNFHTARADVEALPDIVARIGRAVDAELRPITHARDVDVAEVPSPESRVPSSKSQVQVPESRPSPSSGLI